MDEAADCSVCPEAALNANTAWVTSRAVEQPVTITLNVLPLRVT